MGFELRKVPKHWFHPLNQDGFIPLTQEQCAKIIRNQREQPRYLQMYENTTEGTPISPVMKTRRQLARWLSDHQVWGISNETFWQQTCQRGSALSSTIWAMWNQEKAKRSTD